MPSRRNHRVLIYVQHLLGVGHLQRALKLAEALVRRGLSVDLVSGGRPPLPATHPAVRLHQLPPVYCADGSFSQLLDADGKPVSAQLETARRDRLLQLFEQLSPQALITETFPFGRRMLAFELIPLLERARAQRDRTCVIASVRDIIQPKKKPGREDEIVERLESYYDRVLVHGDPRIAGLESSFGATAAIADKLFYSGYICDRAAEPAAGAHGPEPEVLVSAGGSDTGYAILDAALSARAASRLATLRWRILVSPAIDEARFRRLQQNSGDGIVVERNRADFGTLMARASLSISQAGYNTLTDILLAGTPAVVIPYAEAEELEQTLRARAFSAQRRVVMLEQSELDPASLARAVDATASLTTEIEVDLNGAANSAAQIEAWLREYPR